MILISMIKGFSLSLLFISFFYIFSKYFGIKVASSEKELEAIYKFRYDVYKKDLKMSFMDMSKGGAEDVKDYITDEVDKERDTLNIYAYTGSKIRGAIRISFYNSSTHKKKWEQRYGISESWVEKFGLMGELSYLVVEKAYRGGMLALVLMGAAYLICAKRKLFPTLIFAYSMPGLLERYSEVGCYTYTTRFIYDDDGLAIPFVIAPYERKLCNNKYLLSKGCIFDILAKYILIRYRNHLSKSDIERLTKSAGRYLPKQVLHLDNVQKNKIYEQVCDVKHTVFFKYILDTFSHEALYIFDVELNKNVLVSKTTDYDIYFVVDGTFNVMYKNKCILELSPGDSMGEIEHLYKSKRRKFTIQSKTPAKIMLLNRHLIKKLSKPEKAKFYQYLSTEIYKKLDKILKVESK